MFPERSAPKSYRCTVTIINTAIQLRRQSKYHIAATSHVEQSNSDNSHKQHLEHERRFNGLHAIQVRCTLACPLLCSCLGQVLFHSSKTVGESFTQCHTFISQTWPRIFFYLFFYNCHCHFYSRCRHKTSRHLD